MAETTKTPEEVSAEQVKQSEQASIKKAMDTKGFVEFMAKYPDAEPGEVNDAEIVKKKFEVFTVKEVVKKELRTLWGGQIQKDFGLRINPDELKMIDDSLEKKAIENPKEIIELQEKLKQLRELPIQIKALEQEFGEVGKDEDLAKKLQALKTDKGNLEVAKQYKGIGGKLNLAIKYLSKYNNKPDWDYSDKQRKENAENAKELSVGWAALKAVKKEHGSIGSNETTGILEDVKKHIANIEATLEGREKFKELRKELIGGISDVAGLSQALQDRMMMKFQNMLDNPRSLKDVENVQEMLGGLQASNKTTETGVDILGSINQDDVQKSIDEKAERQAVAEIENLVRHAKFGDGALSKLEKSLEEFINKEKLGSMEGDEVREFIEKTLEDVSSRLDKNTVEGRAKSILCARIISNMRTK